MKFDFKMAFIEAINNNFCQVDRIDCRQLFERSQHGYSPWLSTKACFLGYMIYTKTEEMAHLGITFSKTPSKNPKEPEWVGSVLLDGLQLPININMNHWLNWDEHCRLIGRRLGISDWLAVGLFSAGSNAFLPGLRGWVSYEQKQTLLRCIAKDSTEQKGCVT